MGRGKVEMKRIEAKSSRQVTFSKRKGGLMKKAKELAVLCDVEIGIVIFSVGGKLYEFASGGSLRQVHERYLAHRDAEIAVSNNVDGTKKQAEHRAIDLLQILPRHLDEKNLEQLNMAQIVQLEKHLYSILRHAKIRKDKLMAEAIFTLHQKSSELAQENLEMRQELAATSSSSTDQDQAAAGEEVGGYRPDLNAADDTNIGLAPPQGNHNETSAFFF